MKVCLTLFISVMMLTGALAQPIATTFEKASELGYPTTYLDSVYLSAANFNPEKGVFKDRQDQFIGLYREMHQELGNHLFDNDFTWPERISLFTRVYFSKDGSIDFFLLNTKRAKLDQDQEEHFYELLNEFIVDYKIPIQADTSFAQCSPVTYVSPKKDK